MIGQSTYGEGSIGESEPSVVLTVNAWGPSTTVPPPATIFYLRSTRYVSSLQSISTFGSPTAQNRTYQRESSLPPSTKFGAAVSFWYLPGVRTVRGFTLPAFGTPSSAQTYQTQGAVRTQFGFTRYQSKATPSAFVAGVFGSATYAMATNARSLPTTSWGKATVGRVATQNTPIGRGLRCGSMTRVRVVAAAALANNAQPLVSTGFGSPSYAGVVFKARTFCTRRVGTPSASRSTA